MEIKQFVLKDFLKKAELGNLIAEIKKEGEKKGAKPSKPSPQRAKQKETSPANKREVTS